MSSHIQPSVMTNTPIPSMSQSPPSPCTHADFDDYVGSASRNGGLTGYNGIDKGPVYMLDCENMTDYWKERRLDDDPVLRDRVKRLSIQTLDHYSVTFSILVYVGRPDCFEDFMRHGLMNSKLPLPPETRLSAGPTTEAVLDSFRKHQWKFCPRTFDATAPLMHLAQIDDRQILPIKEKVVLNESRHLDSKTTVYKVTFHEGYSSLDDNKPVVFKEYDIKDSEPNRKSWQNEVDILSSIDPHKNIVKYLGSFEQGGRGVVILEFANGGSLYDLFKRDHRLTNIHMMHNFWRAFMGLIDGTCYLHHLPSPSPTQAALGVAHRDIKPSNILVFDDGTGTYTFKLTDFEVSVGPQLLTSPEGTSVQDNDGDRRYRSPEASRVRRQEETQLRQVGLKNDIWAIGCVGSEAAVWLASSFKGLEKYAKSRRAEHTALNQFQKSGYEECFHNRSDVLECVKAEHEAAKEGLPRFDDLTPRLLPLIGECLKPSQARFDANQLSWGFETALQASEKSLMAPKIKVHKPEWDPPVGEPKAEPAEPPRTGSGGSGSRPNGMMEPQQPRPRSRSPFGRTVPKLKKGKGPVDDPYTWRQSTPIFTRVQTNGFGRADQASLVEKVNVEEVTKHMDSGGEPATLPGYQKFCEDIGKRHFIIFIDESLSTHDHIKPVVDMVKVMTWLLEGREKDHIEVRFSSDVSQPYFHKPQGGKHSTGKRVRNFIKKSLRRERENLVDVVELISEKLWHRAQKGPQHVCNMENCLNSLFSDKVVRPEYPTSVFVLTDGIWEQCVRRTQPQGGGADLSIRTLLDKLKKRDINRTQFCIQFVRFGNDNEEAKKRLTYLDNMERDESHGAQDIVDHKFHASNIWRLLIGAVSNAIDNGDSEESDVGSRASEDSKGGSIANDGRTSRSGDMANKRPFC